MGKQLKRGGVGMVCEDPERELSSPKRDVFGDVGFLKIAECQLKTGRFLEVPVEEGGTWSFGRKGGALRRLQGPEDIRKGGIISLK
jgi:hypothetical protein